MFLFQYFYYIVLRANELRIIYIIINYIRHLERRAGSLAGTVLLLGDLALHSG